VAGAATEVTLPAVPEPSGNEKLAELRGHFKAGFSMGRRGVIAHALDDMSTAILDKKSRLYS